MAKKRGPLNSDVNYNIKIDYTDIKSYKPRVNSPVFFPEQRINSQILSEALKPIYNKMNGRFLRKKKPHALNGFLKLKQKS